ncbi:MAG: Gfo/Idh/MocA family oxidoreductase [Chitinophagaceae bacterium]|nr:Gfo/Idh/MocA family oxidoreductase [Chitinophagaceae bacterium]
MIYWGIIGCGDVTEVKSGPAFNKVNGSSLHAVMRRNATKAADYAKRHSVAKWYDDAYALINNPSVTAIYVATPPSTHEEYAIAAMKAGKPVYVEKPFCMNASSARRIAEFSKSHNIKLCVAHYRRQMPIFKKIKELLDNNEIGTILNVNMIFFQEGKKDAPGNWRIDPAVSGGGYFHDLAPHQLDLMIYFFKPPVYIKGVAQNQSKDYKADDAVACTMLFENGALFNGLWSFSVPKFLERDHCEIIGTSGSISFSVFEMKKIKINRNGKEEIISFDPLQHVQQPMIEKVVEYFSDGGVNPCSADDGYTVMWMIDEVTRKY